MSCAVGRTCPSGGRRSTHSCVASPIEYVRFDRPPEISEACSGAPDAPSTFAANHGRSRSRSTPGGVSATGGRLQKRYLRAAGVTRLDGLTVTAGVARDPAHRHVDSEAGRGAVLLGLATPEA